MAYVFLVDDLPDASVPLQRFLELAGHEVGLASSAREALQSILRRPPDLILLDLFMPQMDGLQLLEVLRSYLRLEPLPVVILTAYPDSGLATRSRALGVRRILSKTSATFNAIADVIRAELSREHPPGNDLAMRPFPMDW